MSRIRVRDEDGTVIVSFNDAKISADEAVEQIGKELLKLANSATEMIRAMTLDLEGVEFISSGFIHQLVLLNKLSKQRGFDLRLLNLSPNILMIFKITRLNNIFMIGADADKHDPLRFAPELFEERNEVLITLEVAGFSLLSHFTSVDPLHDIYGIEVRGIGDKEDAAEIQRLLERMYPQWHAPL